MDTQTKKAGIVLLATFLVSISVGSLAQDAKEIVKKSDDKFRGEQTSMGHLSVKIVRPAWERTRV